MEIGTIKKYRKGDIFWHKDKYDKKAHPCVIISSDYQNCADFGGHGSKYQVMKLSKQKPNEFQLPILVDRLDNQISYLICQNIYSYHYTDLSDSTYIGYIDEFIIDLALEIYMVSKISNVNKEILNKVRDSYEEYLNACQKIINKTSSDNSFKITQSPLLPKPIKDALTSRSVVKKTSNIINPSEQKNGYKVPEIYSDKLGTVTRTMESILNTSIKSVVKRTFPYSTKNWIDFELILFYLLYTNNKEYACKVYGFDTISGLNYRYDKVSKELQLRGIID